MVYCKRCESTGEPAVDVAGNNLVEAFMWLVTICVLIFGQFLIGTLLVVAVLMYMSWRKRNTRIVCEHCGSEEIVPLDSPVARNVKWQRVYTPVLHLDDHKE